MGKLDDALKLDLPKDADRICGFIKELVEASGAEGVVVGMSGGVDSALTTALCVRALGPERVLGVTMPLSHTPTEDTQHAKEEGKRMGIKVIEVPIDKIAQSFFKEVDYDPKTQGKLPGANIKARIRMVVLYYFANMYNYLVSGTGDKSEDLIGFFTKYGDGGVDFLPISHLYKTQVREMAHFLKVMPEVADKPASPQLWPGHQASDEIPAAYEVMDPVMVGLFDKNMSPEEVSKETGAPKEVIDLILKKHSNSEHKRKYPPLVEPW